LTNRTGHQIGTEEVLNFDYVNYCGDPWKFNITDRQITLTYSVPLNK